MIWYTFSCKLDYRMPNGTQPENGKNEDLLQRPGYNNIVLFFFTRF